MTQCATHEVRYFSGLDLGTAQDFTALAVLEKTIAADAEAPTRKVGRYSVRHLERFPPGTPYHEVADRMQELFADAPLKESVLGVDQTAVGRPVTDLLRGCGSGAHVRPVTVTAGHHAAPDERGGWLVPKKELVSTLQVLLQARRLRVAEGLAEAVLLARELENFRAKVTLSADEALAAWREGAHDDLVLAVAIAAWEAER